MPSPREILHNRTIWHLCKPSQPVDMERVRNFLLSHKQSQCIQFDKASGAYALSELTPGQEGFFRSPSDDKYIPGTIVNKATTPHSYIYRAQGKRYRRTREHLWPIHINLLPPFPKSHSKQCISRPKPKTTQIPKPSPPSIFMFLKTITRSYFKPPAAFCAPNKCSYYLPQCRRPSSTSACPQPPPQC